jgi:Zn-dependent M28 family amino/carboxypeptidase
LLGSRAYVKQHLGERSVRESENASGDAPPPVSYKPDAEKFSVYFNNDNGTGKVRGVYMQGNEALRPIFRAWLAPFRTMGASTLSLSNTAGTDHTSFDAIGLPGFQFIQDDIEYFSRTWHSTMDVYERAIEDDLKEASVIMATFAYNAAMRDEKIPRKPR